MSYHKLIMYQKAKELVVDIFHLWSKYFSNRQVEPIFKQLISKMAAYETIATCN